MLTAAQANGILRQHMLFITAPLTVEIGNIPVTPIITPYNFSRSSGISQQNQQFSRTIVVDTKSESVQHASKHLEAIENSETSEDAKFLREALITCCSSTQQFSLPQVTLIELIQIFYKHMVYHIDSESIVTGDYILKSLSIFFVCERNEAYQRYALPLIELGVLRPCEANFRNYTKFEVTRFILNYFSSKNLHILPIRELLSRFVCIFCHKSCVEGGNELIYLSHSRWSFEPKPNFCNTNDSLNSPFSPFPENLRRGFLGPIMQFLTSFCINDCKLHDTWGSECCIVQLDGIKIALSLLTLNNTSLWTINPEKGNLDRCDCPTTLVIGFPEDVTDEHIRLGIQRMLDVIELREGCRAELGSQITQSSENFRIWCRNIGDQIFLMTNFIFYNSQSTGYKLNIRPDWEFLCCGGTDKYRIEKGNRIFTLHMPLFLNNTLQTQTLSRKTFALSSDICWSFAKVIDSKPVLGGCFATSLFVGSQVILGDCHPYLISLLNIERNLNNCFLSDLQLPTGLFADDIFSGYGSSRYSEIDNNKFNSNNNNNISSHLWNRVICSTTSGYSLRLAWRYLPAHVNQLLNSTNDKKELTGLFYRSVTIISGDVSLVMLIGSGISSNISNISSLDNNVWDILADVCLQELSEHSHDMVMLSASVTERDNSFFNLQQNEIKEGSTFCISHDLTTGIPTLMGQYGSMRVNDNLMLDVILAKDISNVQHLLGQNFCPKLAYHDDILNSTSFAFSNLPVTRALLGRTSFGSNNINNNSKERRISNVVYARQAGGQELFFTDIKYANFHTVEDNFFSFLATKTSENETAI